MYSDGALILTNDGELTNKLTHPSHDISKTYRLIVKGHLTTDEADAFNAPMTIDGYDLRPVGVRLLRREGAHTLLRFVLHEGRNRQIRKMCAAVSLNVIKLERIALDNLRLGDLAPGEWRDLTLDEIAALRG